MSDSSPVQLVQFERECNESVIELLETWLKDARAGELTAIAMAAIQYTGQSRTAYSKCPDTANLIGAIARLQHRVIAATE